MINITQSDIDAGVQRKCTACPVAIALTRKLGAKWETRVYTNGIYIYDYRDSRFSRSYTCLNSEPLTNFIRTFDLWGKEDVRPGKFAVEIISPYGFDPLS
jgi:hypothetical protein